jgi:glycosyltransferase involved in cell wall biosynthesis
MLSPELPLVVVGEGDGRASELPRGIRSMRDRGIVRFAGRVSDEELRWLYAHCELFLFTSLDEGFGMPPVEALASRARVVATDAEVFRETLGELVTFVDPRDPAAIGDGIRAALAQPAPDDAGEIALRHSWSRTTGVIRDALAREAVGSVSGVRVALREPEGQHDPEDA